MPTSTTRQQTHRRALPHLAALESRQQRVFVLDRHKQPLMPCSPRRAKLLLRSGRARVHRRVPFTIRLVDRLLAESAVEGVQLKIDPGSRNTGVAVAHTDASGTVHGLVAIEVQHRGAQIHRRMITRAGFRRARRNRNLRHRRARFRNRGRPAGWVAPSLQHRVETTLTWVTRLQTLAPVTGLTVEAVRISVRLPADVEADTGNPHEATRRCAYCDASWVPLQWDHVHPRGRGGGDRASNRVWACVRCNRAKGTRTVEDFVADPVRRARILAAATAPRHHAAAATATSAALLRKLAVTGLPLETAPGALTRANRERLGLAKSHTLDALCVGEIAAVGSWPGQVLVARSTGHGSYSRTRSDKFGFPRMRLSRRKIHYGFQTGDRVRVTKSSGTYVGRVTISASGWFTIATPTGARIRASHRYCRLLSKADGWTYTWAPEQP